MTGRLGGSVALSAAGARSRDGHERARGTARVVVTDGKVPHLDLVRTVVLAFGKPAGDTPAGSGEVFSQLAASLAVAGQTLSTQRSDVGVPRSRHERQGTLSLATEALDVHANLLLSRELSAQAGRDLYRLAREGDRVVCRRASRPVASPTVMVDVKAAFSARFAIAPRTRSRLLQPAGKTEVGSDFSRTQASRPSALRRLRRGVSGGSAASMRLRDGSSHGGSTSVSPRCARSSSTAKPGPSVASSNSTPPGSWKYTDLNQKRSMTGVGCRPAAVDLPAHGGLMRLVVHAPREMVHAADAPGAAPRVGSLANVEHAGGVVEAVARPAASPRRAS